MGTLAARTLIRDRNRHAASIVVNANTNVIGTELVRVRVRAGEPFVADGDQHLVTGVDLPPASAVSSVVVVGEIALPRLVPWDIR